MNVITFIKTSLWVLIIAMICFVIYQIKAVNAKSRAEAKELHSNFDLAKNKWRGGIRYPAGLYMEPEELYNIEKNLRYPK